LSGVDNMGQWFSQSQTGRTFLEDCVVVSLTKPASFPKDLFILKYSLVSKDEGAISCSKADFIELYRRKYPNYDIKDDLLISRIANQSPKNMSLVGSHNITLFHSRFEAEGISFLKKDYVLIVRINNVPKNYHVRPYSDSPID
jgi:hypothetical protein